ncbi:MAG: hypothetical protein BM485_03785 [Desulfobulbaceae bacterium DB1]|nr:MAG: hypothetical protein BM485_03785 [Desulfobulbaceae bacterium DB1]
MYKTISLGFSSALILLAFADFLLPSNSWIKDYVRGTFTETVGIIATLLFVNYLFDKNEMNEKEKFKKLFFKHLRSHLVKHLTLLFQMHQSVEETAYKPQKTKDYISEKFLSDLERFDFSKQSPSYPVSFWYQYIVTETNKFRSSLNSLLDRYIIYLDNEMIEMIERLTNSNYYYFLESLPKVFQAYQNNKEHWEKMGIKPSFNFFGDNGLFGTKEIHQQNLELTKHLTDFIYLVELTNNTLSEKNRIQGPQNEPILEKGILHL